MAPQKEIVLKLMSMRYKKAGVSDEKLHEYCTKDHAPRAALIQARHPILKVTHFHTPSATRDMLKKLPFSAGIQPGWGVDDHDITVCFYVRTAEDLMQLMADPDYQAMMAEEVDLIEPAKATLTVGWEEVYIEDGKIVNVVDGQSQYPSYSASVEAVSGEKPSE